MEEQEKRNAWVGIDISKVTFDACCVLEGGLKPQKKEFQNNAAGFAKVARWVDHVAPGCNYRFCMEATGTYHEGVARFLTQAGYKVSVVNPFRTHHSAKARGAGNKTDAADAFTIAEYCRKENPPVWRLATPQVRALLGMTRRLQTVKDMIVQERNRLGDPGTGAVPQVARSIKSVIRALEREAASIERQITDHIDSDPGLKADCDLLVSIKGVGRLTAAIILAELPDVNYFSSAEAAAAYAGLAPSQNTSGTSIQRPTRLSKRGNVHLRRALYMPAISAAQYNPLVKALVQRLRAKGRHSMVAIGAAMRKLLMLAYGVLKSRKPFTCSPVPG